MTLEVDEKSKNLLIGFLGVLFLVIAYFWVYSPLGEKTTELETENVTLEQKARFYTSIAEKGDYYRDEIDSMKQQREALLSKYPVDMTKEDEVMFWVNTENQFANDLSVSALTMNNWEEVLPQVAEQEQPADSTDLDATATDQAVTPDATATDPELTQALDLHLYKAPIDFTYNVTYSGIKQILQFLYSNGNKKNIENFSISYDSSTGNLTGNMNLNLFYMTGTDKEYRESKVPAVVKGVSDVFHTVDGGSVNQVVEENDSAQEAEGAEEEASE